jgi:hypothetical protein
MAAAALTGTTGFSSVILCLAATVGVQLRTLHYSE